jgi:hypothetical protein
MRRFDATVVVFACFVLVSSAAGTARAQGFFTFSAGYSHVELPDAGDLLHGKDGPYIDMDFAARVPQQSLPILVGMGITGSGYFDSADETFRLSPTTVATATLYSDVGFFELEPRVAVAFYSQPRSMSGAFIRPRLGAGLLINSYSIDHVTESVSQIHFTTLHHTGVAFEIRPSVQVGYAWGPGELGVELSYMAAWGDFGDLGSKAQEFRAGVFYTFRI